MLTVDGIKPERMNCSFCGHLRYSNDSGCVQKRCKEYMFRQQVTDMTGDEPLYWVRNDSMQDQLYMLKDLEPWAPGGWRPFYISDSWKDKRNPEEMPEEVLERMRKMGVGDKIDVSVSGWVGTVERFQ